MFFQLPEEQSHATTLQNSSRSRRKRKNLNKKKHKQSFKKKDTKLAITMSSWANDFITAATWQMKHQIAYWKSKARALEYENGLLHEIIRSNTVQTNTYNYNENVFENSHSEVENDEEDDNFEVSEEFIQFLKTNAKYKEDARKERERLKANTREETDNTMEAPAERAGDSIDEFKQLYGKDWQRIAALEMSTQCDFLETFDKVKPMYWPNLPLNFNFS